MQNEDAAPAGLPEEDVLQRQAVLAPQHCAHAGIAPLAQRNDSAQVADATPTTRSPLHPITPRCHSPLRATAPGLQPQQRTAVELSVPACAAEPSKSSIHSAVSPLAARPAQSSLHTSPVKDAQRTVQLRKYKAMCAELVLKNEEFEQSCEHLQQENERLKAQQEASGVAGTELMAEQLAEQLQRLMQEKARLQRDKEQLENDNANLMQLLDYARAMMDDGSVSSPAHVYEECAVEHMSGLLAGAALDSVNCQAEAAAEQPLSANLTSAVEHGQGSVRDSGADKLVCAVEEQAPEPA